MSEQTVLRVSIAATIFMAGFGILFGLLARSSAIVFDGVYELTDAVMTVLALLVARLIAASNAGGQVPARLVERFTMGFWHLEPIVLGLNGMLLLAAATYALINAIDSFMAGGRHMLFDYAIVYALVSLVTELGMAVFATRANRTIGSQFVALDARAWVMSASMSVAWLAAFVFGAMAERTHLAWIVPYIDPVVLAVVCVAVIPLPIGTVRQALADILLVTPADLKHHVDTVAQEVVQRLGFVGYRAYVARVGRGRQIDLYFIVPTEWPARRLEEWDQLRDEIDAQLGGEDPDMWLTIVFTTDPEWAD